MTTYSATGRRFSQFDVPLRQAPCGVAWSPDGKRLLVSVHASNPQLHTLDPSGKHWLHVRLGLSPTSCDVSWR